MLPSLNADLPLIIEAADVPVDLYYDRNMEITSESMRAIEINGIDDEGCEPLVIPPPKEQISSAFTKTLSPKSYTKTARKPYDLTVTLVLLRMKQLAGEAIELK